MGEVEALIEINAALSKGMEEVLAENDHLVTENEDLRYKVQDCVHEHTKEVEYLKNRLDAAHMTIEVLKESRNKLLKLEFEHKEALEYIEALKDLRSGI